MLPRGKAATGRVVFSAGARLTGCAAALLTGGLSRSGPADTDFSARSRSSAASSASTRVTCSLILASSTCTSSSSPLCAFVTATEKIQRPIRL